jgi:peptide-methionine (R)-S-oxide reductase
VRPPRRKLRLSDAEWKQRLTPQQYDVLRRAGTEWARSSPLNNEHRRGTYHCAGCGPAAVLLGRQVRKRHRLAELHTALPDAVATSTDFKLIIPRTEYHCARCDGHHGHLFWRRAGATGKRYCNNGVALRFVPAGDAPSPLVAQLAQLGEHGLGIGSLRAARGSPGANWAITPGLSSR